MKLLRPDEHGVPRPQLPRPRAHASEDDPDIAAAIVRELMLGGLACTVRREVLVFSEGSVGLCLDAPACTLHDLHMGGRLPHAAIAELGRQLITLVVDLHAQHIVHGSITPRSVVVFWKDASSVAVPQSDDETVGLAWPELRLIDFGMSRANGGPTSDVWRTRAPEVCTGHATSPAADVWSLGAIMWYWATGQHIVTRAVASADDALAELSNPRSGDASEAPQLPLLDDSSIAAMDTDVRAVILAALRMDPAARATPAQLLQMPLFAPLGLSSSSVCASGTSSSSASRAEAARAWLARRRLWWPQAAVQDVMRVRPPLAQYLLSYEIPLRVTRDDAIADETAYVHGGKALTHVTTDQIRLVALAAAAVDIQEPLRCLTVILVDRLMAAVIAADGGDARTRLLNSHRSEVDARDERVLVAAALFVIGACYAQHGPLAWGDVLSAAGCTRREESSRAMPGSVHADCMRAVHLIMCASKFRLLSPDAYRALRAQAAWARVSRLLL
jgi:hypothetical protein